MSKAQKGNKENKKPKADKTQTKANVSAYKAAQRASRPAARSRKRPDARFSLKQREAFDLPIEGGKGFPDGGNSEIRQTSGEIGQTHTGFVGWHDLAPLAEPPNGRRPADKPHE